MFYLTTDTLNPFYILRLYGVSSVVERLRPNVLKFHLVYVKCYIPPKNPINININNNNNNNNNNDDDDDDDKPINQSNDCLIDQLMG